jgi:hypothetical protein
MVLTCDEDNLRGIEQALHSWFSASHSILAGWQ